ncbi:MAG TPA: TonB-dependent receptor [Bacteroidales bacterium]
MKLTTLFVLFTTLQLSANTYSQNARITMNVSNGTLSDIFKEIEKQTEYKIFYKVDQINLQNRFSCKADDQTVSEVLAKVLPENGATYDVIDKIIVITPATKQAQKVTGVVTDSKGQPLPGVSVLIKGTGTGTITDVDGKFSVEVPDASAVLVFSFMGYMSEEMTVGNQTIISISLIEDIKTLEEVVVVGYGTVKKSDVTGALTSVNEKTIRERPVQNVIQALQGKASGVDITSNLKPGELPQITIRGNRSMYATNTPLYVVDGIPLVTAINSTSDVNANTAPNSVGIASVNPNDIASVEILKDASATAIYGSRGANGVILITTKKGAKGKVTITYDGTVSLDSYHSLTKWMNGGDYVDRWRLALMNGGLYGNETFTNLNTPVKLGYPDPNLDITKFGLSADPTARQSVLMGYEWVDKIGGTVKTRPTTAEEQANGWPAMVPVYNSKNVRSFDWRNAATRQGITQNHQISLSSGNEVSKLYLSFGYFDQIGVQKDQDYNRYSSTINGDITPTKWLNLGISTNASLSLQNFGIQAPNTANTGSKDLYSRANDQFPYALPKDTLGNWIRNPGGNLSLWNPLIDIDQSKNERRTAAIYSNMFGEIKFTPWLRYHINFGTQYRQYRVGSWTGPNATSHLSNKPSTASYSNTQSIAWVAENLLYFDKTFAKDHTVGLTLLQSTQKYREEGVNIGASSEIYDIDQWYDIASNVNGKPDTYGTSFTQNTLMSYMARVNYSFMSKYLLTASGRWDGASVLAPGHQWDFFPSFALAWKLQEESFLKSVNWLNECKLRLGYGIVGNSSVLPYSTSGPLSKNPYVFGSVPAIGYLPQQVPNPSLAWEKTAQWNIGLDFGVLKNRITGSVEVYQESTSDLIMNKVLPAVSGFVAKIQNVGKTQNRGIEVTLSSINVQTKNFRWSTDINWASNKEKIVELLNGKQDMVAQRYFIGQPIQVYYNYRNAGIWQNTAADLAEMAKFNANGHKFYPGTVKVVDQNGDYKITGDDMVVLGTRNPKWTGGITNTLSYQNLELSFFVYARIGQMYFGGYPNSYGGVWPNGRVENNVWSWDNPGGKWPMPNLGNVENISQAMNYCDGSYVIVRNISLSYNLPSKILGKFQISRLQVFTQVLNPFIFGKEAVKYGINPEDITDWDRVSTNQGPLGGMNNNTILQQSIVFGLRAGF